jgi:hypothetical protein
LASSAREVHVTRAKLALVGGLVLMVIAIVVTLSGSPLVVAHANGTVPNEAIVETASEAEACQGGEALPAGISAIRLTLSSVAGPRVSLTVLSGTRVLAAGAVGSGWTSGAVTVPVRPVARAVSHVRVCFRLGPTVETVAIYGSPTPTAVAARDGAGAPLPGRITVEYMRSARGTWWSAASGVARHIGLGRAPSGSWVALLLVVLMGAAVASASWLVAKGLG